MNAGVELSDPKRGTHSCNCHSCSCSQCKCPTHKKLPPLERKIALQRTNLKIAQPGGDSPDLFDSTHKLEFSPMKIPLAQRQKDAKQVRDLHDFLVSVNVRLGQQDHTNYESVNKASYTTDGLAEHERPAAIRPKRENVQGRHYKMERHWPELYLRTTNQNTFPFHRTMRTRAGVDPTTATAHHYKLGTFSDKSVYKSEFQRNFLEHDQSGGPVKLNPQAKKTLLSSSVLKPNIAKEEWLGEMHSTHTRSFIDNAGHKPVKSMKLALGSSIKFGEMPLTYDTVNLSSYQHPHNYGCFADKSYTPTF